MDWESILRVQSRLNTFDIEEAPLFLSVIDVGIYVKSVLPLCQFVHDIQERMGGRQPAFRRLQSLDYRSVGSQTDVVDGCKETDQRKPIGAMQAISDDCLTLQTLVVDIAPELFDSHRLANLYASK